MGVLIKKLNYKKREKCEILFLVHPPIGPEVNWVIRLAFTIKDHHFLSENFKGSPPPPFEMARGF